MKKHLLGLAIFSFIFVSFAFAFAFFYAPQIPQIAEVKENFSSKQTLAADRKTSCFRNKRENISVKIVNSQYFFDENKIISEIKIDWNGAGAPPEKIYLTTLISDSENKTGSTFDGVVQILEKPFNDAAEETFKIVSRNSRAKKNKQNNLYAVAAVSEFSGDETGQINKNVSEAKEVVFVHGETSVIGN